MRLTKALVAAAATISAVSFAGSASANLITINGGAGTLTCNGATVGACSAFIGGGSPGEPTSLGTLSGTNADEYDGAPANPSDMAARLNALAGTAFTGSATLFDGQQFTINGGSDNNPDSTFNSLGIWVVMKIGNDVIFIRNNTGGQLTIAYDSAPGQGSGLSHWSQFGQAVPIPGALWLMGAGLAGLGFAGSRKKKA